MESKRYSIALVLFCLCVACGLGQTDIKSGRSQDCVTATGARIHPFEVLAGGGWDNLRNKDQAMVMALNYSRCRITDDGKFLIPDNLYMIPVKSSRVETYAELFEHWDNYTSTVASSLNAEAGFKAATFKISGKYSNDFTSVKKHMYFDKSVTTRVQLRYVSHTARLMPGSSLSDEFRGRLRQIAAHLRLNRTASAWYESQLVVRDYGTHVVTSVDVGAALTQTDHLDTSFVEENKSEKNKVLASASASFFGGVKSGSGSLDFSKTTDTQMIDQYLTHRTSSEIETFGGPIFRLRNFTASDWSAGVSNNMVAIDRSGDPIYYVITEDTLPDVPDVTVARVRDYIKQAVWTYYKQNTYYGCTKRESPNFSFTANADDGTCKPTKTNYTFGGLYQSCQGSGYTDLCSDMRQQNPLTGDYSCPEGYQANLVQEGSFNSARTESRCRRCKLFRRCCDDVTETATAHYTAYWCSATKPPEENTGFLFGGSYTRLVRNPVTGSNTCPRHFYALKMLSNLFVCVSYDYELGTPNSLPFAGFFSCKSGNPLSLPENAGLVRDKRSILERFIRSENTGTSYPKRCPEGYSQHLAVNDKGCEINYCVKAGALTRHGLPKVQLPPFLLEPQDDLASSESVVFDEEGELFLSGHKADEFLQEGSGDGVSDSGSAFTPSWYFAVIIAIIIA